MRNSLEIPHDRPAAMSMIPPSLSAKLIETRQIGQQDWSPDRPLVFTNGVFDVLHPGHVICLELARSLGASLLVAVNTDASARRLGKGPGKPVNTERDRALLLAGLQSVSWVTGFDEATPCELIRLCRPDVYVKGGDYDMEALEETRLVRSWGGRSLAIPLVPGYSSSGQLERLRGAVAPEVGDVRTKP